MMCENKVMADMSPCFLEMRAFECQVCQNTFCPHCQEQPHPGLTCEEFEEEELAEEVSHNAMFEIEKEN